MTGPTLKEVEGWLQTANKPGPATWEECVQRFSDFGLAAGLTKDECLDLHHAARFGAALNRALALAFAAGARSGEDARDAARYRWLRERSGFRSDPPVVDIIWNVYKDGRYVLTQSKHTDALDAAIDAAMGGNDA